MLIADSISKKFSQKKAVDSLSFSVQKGKITGLLGPNGAGKTTTLRILTGYLKPSSGRVIYDDLNLDSSPWEVQKKLGYLPENAPLYQDMTVEEYLQFMADARAVPGSERKRSIERVTNACQLNSHFYHPIFQLSKGFRQRVALGACLIHDPDYLILDEPSTGLDPNQITEIRKLILSIAKEKTVILSTHILQEVMEICDQVLILSNGKKVLDAPTENLGSSTLVQFQIQARYSDLIGFFEKSGMKDLREISEVGPGNSGSPESKIGSEEPYRDFLVDSAGFGSEGVFKILASLERPVRELKPFQRSLESVFSELTIKDKQK